MKPFNTTRRNNISVLSETIWIHPILISSIIWSDKISNHDAMHGVYGVGYSFSLAAVICDAFGGAT